VRDAAQRRHEADLAQLRAASGAELKAELAQMRAASEAELAQLRTTCAEQAAELATLREAAARHAAVAFEERAPQSYQVGESADAVDIAFANALHAANLPLLVACERVSKGVYKVATLERRSYGARGARGRGRLRRVQIVLNPNGLAHVRVGAGTQSLA